MLTPNGKKSPLPEKFSAEEDRTQDAASSRTVSPKHYPLSYSGPHLTLSDLAILRSHSVVVCATLKEPLQD